MTHMRTWILSGIAALALFALVSPAHGQEAPVRLRVLVAANARLEIDGAATAQSGTVRNFESPPVEVGKNYFYNLKATWTEQGRALTSTKRVKVQPGKEVEVDLRQADVGSGDADKGSSSKGETPRQAAVEVKPAPAKEPTATETKKPQPAKEKDDEPKRIKEPDVIFVPTPQAVVDKMLELAEIKAGDVVYDLGCGDGRIVCTAAKKFGVKAYGFDVDPQRIKESKANVKKNKVEELATIEQKDVFTLDLSKANVVTLYLLPELNVKLIPQLEKLKPGSRIVSHDFDMKGIKPKKTITMKAADDDGREDEHTIYLWVTPLEKEKE